MGKYLKLARKAANAAGSASPLGERQAGKEAPRNRRPTDATKATEATKAPALVLENRDKSDRSDKRAAGRALTLREVLAEMNRQDSGAAKNAELYRRGELSEEKAVEYATCAILHRRGERFEGWQAHAETVRAALAHYIDRECEAGL